MQTYWLLCSPSKPVETASSANSPFAPFPPDCHFVERLRDRKRSWEAVSWGIEKVSSRAVVTRKNKKLELTDIKGIEHVAGSLSVIATTPYVDGVIYEHCRVPIPHVGHLSHMVSAVCPHWRQLDPAQRH